MEGDNASKSTIPTHKTEEEDEKQQPAACEYGGWHGDDGQECIMEDVVEQPHSDSLGGHIAWQDSCDKPMSYLFLDPISKDVEKRSQKVAGGLTEKDLQLLRITTPGNTEIQCFIAARRVLPFPVRDDPPTFQAEHRRERDRLHRELAKMEDAIEARGSEPTTEEAAKTTRLRRRMDTLASGKAEESPKSSVDPELHSHLSSSISSTSQPSSTSKTHSSIQSSATTNTQSNTEANSSLDAPSGKVHNDQKKWPFSLLQKFWK